MVEHQLVNFPFWFPLISNFIWCNVMICKGGNKDILLLLYVEKLSRFRKEFYLRSTYVELSSYCHINLFIKNIKIRFWNNSRNFRIENKRAGSCISLLHKIWSQWSKIQFIKTRIPLATALSSKTPDNRINIHSHPQLYRYQG